MLVDHNHRFVFIHNPKTGGTSIIKALGGDLQTIEPALHLTPLEAINCFFKDRWDDYHSFSFVRNPWDRAVSLYLYHRSIAYATFLRGNMSHQIAMTYSFQDWILVNASKIRQSIWLNRPQSDWSYRVRDVLPFEEFPNSFNNILSEIGISGELYHENKTEHDHYSSYYTDVRCIEYIRDIDRDTILRFGYKFEC